MASGMRAAAAGPTMDLRPIRASRAAILVPPGCTGDSPPTVAGNVPGATPLTVTRRMLFNMAASVPGVSRVPAVRNFISRRRVGTRGTDSARYCYGVWLRHLLKAYESGIDTHPETIAELGPGDSLGAGLAALLTGASRYFAFDVVEHASSELNVTILHELVSLFRARAPIPDRSEFPRLIPNLADYAFPSHILAEDVMRATLDGARLRKIEESVRTCTSTRSWVQYRAPWFGSEVIEPATADMIFSQAVLEHVDDLPGVYRAMRLWLKSDGLISHAIDFKSHGFAREWNGQWTHSELKWKLIRGKDSWLINREPHSTHLRLLEQEGFRLICHVAGRRPSTVRARDLAARFRNMSEDDLTTADVFLQAVKQR